MSDDPPIKKDPVALTPRTAKAELAEKPPDPPVVARLVIEIRSDGSRTIARGAMEDIPSGQRVDLAVEAGTPIALLWKLVRTLGQTPSLASRTVRGLLGGGKKKEK